MTYLFYSWKFDPLDPFIHFACSQVPTSANHHSVFHICEFGMIFMCFVF